MKWIIIFLVIPFYSFSQQTAYFETTIYLEDAVGNRDSVIVGHDESANSVFNPEFGEIDITQPWDSVFEVRAAHSSVYMGGVDNLVQSKKIIGPGKESSNNANLDCLLFTEPIIIFVNVKNLPLKISWEIDDFRGSYCRNRSILTPHLLEFVSLYWIEGQTESVDYACMGNSEHFETSVFDIGEFGFFLLDEVEGKGIDTIQILLVSFQSGHDTDCSMTVSTTETEESEPIHVFPNPASGIVHIEFDNFDFWNLRNQFSGLMISGKEKKVDISELPSGIYFLSLYDKTKRLIQTKKVVKVD